ncbi:MAG: hypothetical protein WA672_21035, partial [Candidatus Angelobacter sp.]
MSVGKRNAVSGSIQNMCATPVPFPRAAVRVSVNFVQLPNYASSALPNYALSLQPGSYQGTGFSRAV